MDKGIVAAINSGYDHSRRSEIDSNSHTSFYCESRCGQRKSRRASAISSLRLHPLPPLTMRSPIFPRLLSPYSLIPLVCSIVKGVWPPLLQSPFPAPRLKPKRSTAAGFSFSTTNSSATVLRSAAARLCATSSTRSIWAVPTAAKLNLTLTSELPGNVVSLSLDPQNVTLEAEHYRRGRPRTLCAPQTSALVLADVRSLADRPQSLAGIALPLHAGSAHLRASRHGRKNLSRRRPDLRL